MKLSIFNFELAVSRLALNYSLILLLKACSKSVCMNNKSVFFFKYNGVCLLHQRLLNPRNPVSQRSAISQTPHFTRRSVRSDTALWWISALSWVATNRLVFMLPALTDSSVIKVLYLGMWPGSWLTLRMVPSVCIDSVNSCPFTVVSLTESTP